MRRASGVLLVAAFAAIGAPSARAATTVPERVFIEWNEGLFASSNPGSLNDGNDRAGSGGLVPIPVGSDAKGALLAATTLGAGGRTTDTNGGASALRLGLERAGMSVVAVVVAGRENTARAVMGQDVSLRVLKSHADVVSMRFDAGTAVFMDLGVISRGLGERATARDLVVEVSPGPAPPRGRAMRLGFAMFWGPGFPRGVLSSPTTRRRGIIALADITPTILAAVHPLHGGSFEGRAARAHEVAPVTERGGVSADSLLFRLGHDLTAARTSRAPITRTFLYASMLLVVLGLALRGRTLRALTALALGVLAMPIVGFLGPLLPGGPRAVVVSVVAVIVGAGAAALGARNGAIAIASLTALIPLIDLVLGSPIGHRSPWGLTLATGGRFYGASEDTLGFVLGGSLVACALLLERHRERLPLMVVALAVATAILSAPSLGAKFGAIPTLVPAFGVLAVRALDRTVTLRIAAAIALATVVATGGSVLADRLRPQEQRSHVARAIGGETDVGDLIARKWRANADVTFTRAWAPAALVAGAGLIVLARRRRISDGLRKAGPAVAVGAATAMIANDGGVVTAAILLALVAAASIATARRSPATDVE